MKIAKKIFNTIITILIVMVLIVSIFIAALALTSKASGIATIFGYTFQTIQTDSMDGGYKGHMIDGELVDDGYTGGNFKSGDMLIGKATDFDVTRTYSRGDIITYKGYLAGAEEEGEKLICHRIVDVYDKDGTTCYQTWGDNEAVAELPDQKEVKEYIGAHAIASVIHNENFDATNIKGIGKFFDFLRSQLGFFLIVLLPMIIFFLYELIRVVLNISGYKKAKQEDAEEKIRKEYEEKIGQQAISANGAPVYPSNQVYPTQESSPQYTQPAQPVQPVQPVQPTPQQSAPSMSQDEFRQFQEFQEFKRMQQMYNQQQSAENTTTAENAENTEGQ